MESSVSPFRITYSVAETDEGGGGGGAVTTALVGAGSAAGGFVSGAVTCAVVLVSVGVCAVLLVSGGVSRLQPWISIGVMTRMLTAKMVNTATWNRVRFLFFCSSKEPWGMNGFGLFIYRWRSSASFHCEVVFLGCYFCTGVFPQKNPGQIVNFFTRRRSRPVAFWPLPAYCGVSVRISTTHRGCQHLRRAQTHF